MVTETTATGNTEFQLQVLLPVFILLIGILIVFILLLRKYTFGKWSVENPNPFAGETFAMPRGVFRGMLTFALLFVVVILEIYNIRFKGLEKELEQLFMAFQMMIAFYFGSKVMHHLASTDRKKSEAIAASINQENKIDNSVFSEADARG